MGLNLLPWILETEGLDLSERMVLIEYAYHADRKGIVRHTQSDIASIAGLSRRTVARQVEWLTGNGILKRIGHGRYQLNRQRLEDLDYWLTGRSQHPKEQATTSR